MQMQMHFQMGQRQRCGGWLRLGWMAQVETARHWAASAAKTRSQGVCADVLGSYRLGFDFGFALSLMGFQLHELLDILTAAPRLCAFRVELPSVVLPLVGPPHAMHVGLRRASN